MFTANTAASNTASSAPAVSFREGDFYDLAADTDDYSAGLYEIPVTDADCELSQDYGHLTVSHE